MRKRLVTIEQDLPTADPLNRLHLVQEKIDIETALQAQDTKADLETLEKEFVEAAGPYSARKGISFVAWRELGVPSTVLNKAGIGRG